MADAKPLMAISVKPFAAASQEDNRVSNTQALSAEMDFRYSALITVDLLSGKGATANLQ